MSNLIDEQYETALEVQRLEKEATAASKLLRECKLELRKARTLLYKQAAELKHHESQYPLFERIQVTPNGQAETTPDEHQRGPTHFPPAEEAVCGSFEWTSTDLNDQLEAACYPAGWQSKSPWPQLREYGCDDAKILEVLRAIWPQGPRFEGLGVGRTIRGGVTPAIWIGKRKSKDQKPTLDGLELADRVRTILGIPREPAEAINPPAAKRSKPRRKAAAEAMP